MNVSLAALPDLPTQRGGDPDLLRVELVHHISAHINNHPRSLQDALGPSEVGHPCDRHLAHKLLGTKPTNQRPAPWRPTVGTAVHAWLETAFTEANRGHDVARWLTELTVTVGQVAGTDITGHCDLYDRVTATAIDWKVVGPTSLKTKKSKGVGDQYRAQIHLYGRGLAARGLPIDTVMIVCLPSSGELADAYVWHEPYDEQVALDALARLEAIHVATAALGAAAPAVMATADAFCGFCDFFTANADDLVSACPGHPDRARKDALSDLVA